MVKDLTNGSPFRLIINFSLPLLCGNLFQQLYSMADAFVVGNFVSENAFGAVSAGTGPINFLIIGFMIGICTGFGVPISRYFGAGNTVMVRRAIVHAAYWAAIITFIMTVITAFFTRPLLVLMNTNEEHMKYAYDYIIVIFYGMFATMVYNLLASIARALGDSRTPLYFLVMAVIINVGLDFLFVAGLKWGVTGAAVATVISQIASGTACFVYMWKKFPILRMKKSDFAPSKKLTGEMLVMGLPMGFQFSITAIGTVVLQSYVNLVGAAATNAISAGSRVSNIVTQPMETIGLTMATFCGQNLGAKRGDRIKQGLKCALLISGIYCIFASTVMILFGHYAAYLFSLKDREAISAILPWIKTHIMWNAGFYPLLALLFILRNSIQGLGYAVPATAAGLFELVARAGVGILLVKPLIDPDNTSRAFMAVCTGNPIAWVAALMLLIPCYIVVYKKVIRKIGERGSEVAA